jgi:hypothetical protein
MKNITEDKIVENQAMDSLPVEIEPVLDRLNLDNRFINNDILK